MIHYNNNNDNNTVVRRVRTIATADNELRVMLYEDGVITSAQSHSAEIYWRYSDDDDDNSEKKKDDNHSEDAAYDR